MCLQVQTGAGGVASVSVEHHNPALVEERDALHQELADVTMEKEQLEMTITELSKTNALMEEQLSKLRQTMARRDEEARSQGEKAGATEVTAGTSAGVTSAGEQKSEVATVNGDGGHVEVRDGQKVPIDAVVEKDRRIRSLQIQISRLQQQIAVGF